MIKSFRGQLADNEIETIRLGTNNGLIGYKIKKFEGIAQKPGRLAGEHLVQLYSVPVDTASDQVDFDSPTLLAVLFSNNTTAGESYPPINTVIFDNVTFNQDIYIAHQDVSGTGNFNYHIELEQVKLDLGEATVATLKDMRGRN